MYVAHAGAWQGAILELVRQPSLFARLGDRLNDNLARPEWTSFRAAIAFVKRSGTRHIADALSVFSRAADVEIIAGIDHGGTSAEGLRDLLRAVSPQGRVIVFHNRLPLTFHPKIYLFRNAQAAELLIGSGNLTEGGLFTNYEAGLHLALDLAAPGDATILGSVEQALDAWADTSLGTARLLDDDLLLRLSDLGLAPPEASISAPIERSVRSAVGPDPRGGFLFAARSEARAPPVANRARSRGESAAGLGSRDAPASRPSSSVQDRHRGFVMTLQQTDVGAGQATAGTSKRSPEIFVPLAARDADPYFWGWPHAFIPDPHRPDKRDRHGVRVLLGGQLVNVNMMTWPDRHDFRLRAEALRSAGGVGDVLHMAKADPSSGHDYEVEIIPRGTVRYAAHLAKCRVPVRNSQKRYGYY